MNPPFEILQDAGEIGKLLDESRRLVEASLDTLLPAAEASPQTVHQAIRWSVFAGGKRFRPALLLASGRTFGAPADALLNTACALEMVHTYSLIHDDLPSMDDDDLRRGRPTCHVKYGEANAILAGDALQTLAFHTIADDQQLEPQTRVRLVGELSRAAGTPQGMVAGQALDIEGEKRNVTGEELEEIHRLKTAALIICAVRCGAIIAGANEKELEAVTSYATNLGLLFQITDDLLDVTATEKELGKTPGKDARSAKATYPALYGLEEARAAAAKAHRDAIAALDTIDQPTDSLRQIAAFTLNRSR
ncbi:MAG TPA: farnesyl diphosphate synthase [Pyrinomonadaceae bacterium]|nr:farnesyl diphosphate synthase [Pyrinomonadaceae bacterium]